MIPIKHMGGGALEVEQSGRLWNELLNNHTELVSV